MKLIVAGGRHYQLTGADREALDRLWERLPVTELVSGGATGADAGGEEWWVDKGDKPTVIEAEWTKYGVAAGPIRNRAMAKYADAVALFPGGKGTRSMLKEAKTAGILIFDYREQDYCGMDEWNQQEMDLS